MWSYTLGPVKAICEGQRPLHTRAQKSRKGQMGSGGQVGPANRKQTFTSKDHALQQKYEVRHMPSLVIKFYPYC